MKAGDVIKQGTYEHLKRERRVGGDIRDVRAEKVDADSLLAETCAEGCCPAPAPSREKPAEETAERLGGTGPAALDAQAAGRDHTGVETALCLEADWWDIQREVVQCARALSAKAKAIMKLDLTMLEDMLMPEASPSMNEQNLRVLSLKLKRDRGPIMKKVGCMMKKAMKKAMNMTEFKFDLADLGTEADPVDEFVRLRALCGVVVPSGAAG